jgi:hypothetical protein
MIGVGYGQIESTLCDCGAGSETAGPLAVVISSPCCVPRDRGDINDLETIKVIV